MTSIALLLAAFLVSAAPSAEAQTVTINGRDDGYRGIWYMNQPSGDEYVYKYSGGLGTYCAKHKPFAVYRPEVDKTFFCYGGAAQDDNRRLIHMVSYFDHTTGTVPRPTILLDKKTDDAHDNPVISVDADNHPVILYLTSPGYESGPKNDPRTFTTARWTGTSWDIRPVTTSDNNYDMGSLSIEESGLWRIIAPTERGPQPYNPGGEIAMWTSSDRGAHWTMARRMTAGSPMNHTFARRPVNAHPGFYAFWADGHGRQPSESNLYFSDRDGAVFRLPRVMTGDTAKPERMPMP